MEWNVYVENFNTKEIEVWNVFDHSSLRRDIAKLARRRGLTKEVFEESMKTNMMYYYWSKCEWEIILQAWPPRKDFRDEKIDVYDQVKLNWGIFIDYCWSHRSELKKLDKDDK